MSFVNACRTNCVSLQEDGVQEIKVVDAHKGTKMLKYFFGCCGRWKMGMGKGFQVKYSTLVTSPRTGGLTLGT